MTRMLKVYDGDAEKVAQIPGARVVESYPAFVLVEATDIAARELTRKSLTEDITDQYQLDLHEPGADAGLPRRRSTGIAADSQGAAQLPDTVLTSGPHHYVLQFIGPVKQDWLSLVRKAGGEVVAPYGGFAVIARLSPGAVKAVAKLPVVRAVHHLPYATRLSKHIRQQMRDPEIAKESAPPRTRVLAGTYTVQFFRSDLAKKARSAVKRLGFDIVEYVEGAQAMIVHLSEKNTDKVYRALEALARIHGVRRVSSRPIRRTSNDRAVAIMATAAMFGNSPGLGLSGAGEIIGVCDTGLDNGDPKTIHPDFAGRVAAIKSYPVGAGFGQAASNVGHDDGPADLASGHGTHVCGSVLGDGTASAGLEGLAGPIRGMSYRAKLVLQAVEQEVAWNDPADANRYGRFVLAGLPNDLETLFSYAYRKGARIHSNSWGGGDAGAYDEQCEQVDRFIWSKQDFCILFAAGNDGTDANADGQVDQGSVTPPGTAKNCITVGASENLRPTMTMTYGGSWPTDYPAEPLKSDRIANNANDIAAFSSRGPTGDGRMKPDIVAPGTYILSTRSRMLAENNFGYGRYRNSKFYMFDSGTSMATPLTAGAVGVVREYLRKTVGIASPTAALLKAALIAGAVTTRPRLAVPDCNEGFGRLNLDAILKPPAATKVVFIEGRGLNTGDLDDRTVNVTKAGSLLKIVLVYSDYPGPKLVNNLNLIVREPGGSAYVGNSRAPATFDSTNNVEMVIVPKAQVGKYKVQVVGSNVPEGPQTFALVIVGAVTT